MFIHKGTVVLESSRLILRRFTMEDVDVMFTYASDAETTRFMRFSTHKSKEDSESIIRLWVDAYDNPKVYNCAMVCKECGELIGSIGLVDVNDFHKQAEIGYIIRKDHWNKGYTTEAVQRVFKYAFEEVGFHRIESLHAQINPASGKVMKKAGMQFEGVKKNYFPFEGHYISCDMYAIVSGDYFKQIEYDCLFK